MGVGDVRKAGAGVTGWSEMGLGGVEEWEDGVRRQTGVFACRWRERRKRLPQAVARGEKRRR